MKLRSGLTAALILLGMFAINPAAASAPAVCIVADEAPECSFEAGPAGTAYVSGYALQLSSGPCFRIIGPSYEFEATAEDCALLLADQKVLVISDLTPGNSYDLELMTPLGVITLGSEATGTPEGALYSEGFSSDEEGTVAPSPGAASVPVPLDLVQYETDPAVAASGCKAPTRGPGLYTSREHGWNKPTFSIFVHGAFGTVAYVLHDSDANPSCGQWRGSLCAEVEVDMTSPFAPTGQDVGSDSECTTALYAGQPATAYLHRDYVIYGVMPSAWTSYHIAELRNLRWDPLVGPDIAFMTTTDEVVCHSVLPFPSVDCEQGVHP